MKTYKFVDFTSQMKIGLSSAERIYLIYAILENAKTCVCGNKADDVLETNPITVTFCYCPEMKISVTLNIYPGFYQRCNIIHK